MTTNPPPGKSALRAQMRERRLAMSAQEAAAASHRIINWLRCKCAGVLTGDSPLIMGYYPVRNEASGLPWLEEQLKSGRRVALPRMAPGGSRIEARIVTSLVGLQPGAYGIPEPGLDNPLADPGAIDLCLIPGLAFDRHGARLGQGGGHYDRFLEALRPGCLKVALAFHWQIVNMIPMEGWDKRVDWIITEQGLIQTDSDSQ